MPIVHRFLSLFLAGLLLLTGTPLRATVGHGNGKTVPVKKALATQKAAKSNKTTTPKSAETTVSEASFDAVVTPAVSFDFGPIVFVLPTPVVVYLLNVPARWFPHPQTPYYFFAYFRHVFGHFIAPNAP